MDDLAYAFRAKLAEFSIDRNATSGMDHGKGRIAAVNRVQPDRFVCFVFSNSICVIVPRSRRSGQHLELIRRFVQSQCKSSATLVPFPSAKRNKPRASSETFSVIVDDVMGMRSGYKPPDN